MFGENQIGCHVWQSEIQLEMFAEGDGEVLVLSSNLVKKLNVLRL